MGTIMPKEQLTERAEGVLHLRRRRVDGDDVGEVVVHVVESVAGDDPVHFFRLRPGHVDGRGGDVSKAHVQRLTRNWTKTI